MHNQISFFSSHSYLFQIGCCFHPFMVKKMSSWPGVCLQYCLSLNTMPNVCSQHMIQEKNASHYLSPHHIFSFALKWLKQLQNIKEFVLYCSTETQSFKASVTQRKQPNHCGRQQSELILCLSNKQTSVLPCCSLTLSLRFYCPCSRAGRAFTAKLK